MLQFSISLHFDIAQYRLAQDNNRVNQLLKIIQIPLICVPKNQGQGQGQLQS